MKNRAWKLALVMLVAWASPAKADVEDQLKAVMADIQAARADAPQAYAANTEKLKKDIAQLGQLIAGKQLNKEGVLVAYYVRGRAQQRLSELNKEHKKPYDVALARAALADYDRVIKGGVDMPGWFYLGTVTYYAGWVAANQLVSFPLAYSYWAKCAAADDATCLNLMADAHLTGKGGIKVDIAQSLATHKKVYLAGTRAVCSGASSANSIALLSHLTRAPFEDADALTWFQRANELLDKREGDPCGRSDTDIDEFLVRLARGETADAVLDRALGRARVGDPQKAIIGLLRGNSTQDAFNKALAAAFYDGQRCQMQFDAMWFAALKGDAAGAQARRQAMTEIPDQRCATQLAYAKLLRI